MSVNYGYRCVTCRIDGPLWYHNGDDILKQAYEQRMVILVDLEKARQALNLFDIELTCWRYCDMGDGDLTLPEFLREHGEHELMLLDGYGRTEAIT